MSCAFCYVVMTPIRSESETIQSFYRLSCELPTINNFGAFDEVIRNDRGSVFSEKELKKVDHHSPIGRKQGIIKD
jgi:hypothetical protein